MNKRKINRLISLPRIISTSCFGIALSLLLVSGCSFHPIDVGSTDGVLTNADYRFIFERTRDTEIIGASSAIGGASGPTVILGDTSLAHGKQIVSKHKVICAEPSPDAIVAIAEKLSANVSGVGPTQSAGAGANSDYTQTITALGQRTATIQMLRDYQYRVCEAYANGAMDDVEYAVRMNRFNSLVVTLMGMESVAELGAASAVGSSATAASSVSAVDAIVQMQENYLDKDDQYATSIVCYQVLSNHAYDNLEIHDKCINYFDEVIIHGNDPRAKAYGSEQESRKRRRDAAARKAKPKMHGRGDGKGAAPKQGQKTREGRPVPAQNAQNGKRNDPFNGGGEPAMIQ